MSRRIVNEKGMFEREWLGLTCAKNISADVHDRELFGILMLCPPRAPELVK